MDPLTLALAALCLLFIGATGVLLLRLTRSRRLLDEQAARIAALETRLGSTPERLSRRAADLAVRAVVTTARGVRDQGVGGFLASSIEDFTGWSVAERWRINNLAGDDGTVTVLFSDIEGSTALNESLGDEAWMELLDEHDAVVRAWVRRHRGHVVKHQGDGFMLAFGSVDRALHAATAIQEELASINDGSGTPALRVRMGAHRGPTVERDGDFFGRNVAYAARVAAAATGAEILVSDDVRTRLGTEWTCDGPRVLKLKGFPGDHHAWLVRRTP